MLYITEFAASLSDTELIALASQEERLLLTADKDFGELVFRRGQAVPGLILLRIDPGNGRSYEHGFWKPSISSAKGFSGGMAVYCD